MEKDELPAGRIHVEIKACVGEKVYMPWSWEGSSGIAELEVIRIVISKDKTRYFTKIESDSIAFLRKYRFGTFNESDFGKTIFTNLKAAQAAR